MTKCKGCGNELRKGALALLLIGGKLVGARVCRKCEADGVLIVAPKLAPVVKKVADRSDGVQRALRMLRTLAAAAHHAARSAPSGHSALAQFQGGRAEGFDGAIEAIKRECGVGQ